MASAYEQIKEGLEDALDWVNNLPKKPSWRELIEERERTERLERERQLEEGRKAWAKLKQELLDANTTTYPPLSDEEINYFINQENNL